MTFPLPPLPFAHLPGEARVWIYQTGHGLEPLLPALEAHLTPFVQNWQSHGAPVQGGWALYAGAFVMVAALEPGSGVSGCSTDGLVRVMQALSAQTGYDFFNRTDCGLFSAAGLTFVPLAEVRQGKLPASPEALWLADLTVTHLHQIRAAWPIPLTNSGIRIKTTDILRSHA